MEFHSRSFSEVWPYKSRDQSKHRQTGGNFE